MEKRKADYRLATHSRKILLVALPMIIIQLIAFIIYLAPLDSWELVRNQQLIYSVFDAVGRGLIFTIGGTLILDYMEKKNRKKHEE